MDHIVTAFQAWYDASAAIAWLITTILAGVAIAVSIIAILLQRKLARETLFATLSKIERLKVAAKGRPAKFKVLLKKHRVPYAVLDENLFEIEEVVPIQPYNGKTRTNKRTIEL